MTTRERVEIMSDKTVSRVYENWEDIEEEYDERTELDDFLSHESSQDDDNPPMFSVVGRVYFDPNTDKFSYYDADTGRVVKLSW